MLPLLLATAIWQMHIKTDISAFFMSGGSAETNRIAGNMQTGELSRRYILSIAQPDQARGAPEITEQLRQALSALPGIHRVWGSGMSEKEVDALIAFYLPYRYQLFSLNPEASITPLFSDNALHNRAASIRQALLSPQGQTVKQIIQTDPLFIFSTWLQQLAGNRSADQRYASLIVETVASGLDSAAQQPIKQQIEQTFERINSDYNHRYTLAMTGVPIFAMAVKQQVTQDVTLVSSASSVIMLLLFVLLFRSLRTLLVVSLTLIASASAATLVTSLLFGEIHALTLALGTTLIGICVDYPIHTIVHAAGSNNSPVESTRRIWPSLLLGALTTIIGYAALSFTGYPGMQQIALYAGSGILTALLISRFILPYALPDHSQRPLLPAVDIGRWLQFTNRSRLQWPLILTASLLLALGAGQLNWNNDISRLSPSLNELKQNDQQIRSRIQSIEPGRFILVHAPTMEAALQANEALLLRLEQAKKEGTLDAYFSVFPWLASNALQQRNTQSFSQQFTAAMLAQWHRALGDAGIHAAALPEPVIPEQPPLTINEVLTSPAARYIAGQYITTDQETILTIWLGRHNSAAIERIVETMERARYVSQKDMINEINATYADRTVTTLSIASLLILLLLAWRYRNLKRAVTALAPAILAAAIVLTGWGFSGLPFGMLHLLGMLLAVAICVDYGIFFVENRSGDYALTYRAIVISALTTIAAFACLGLAENPALQALAWTIAPGVLLGFLLCPLLIRTKVAMLAP